MQDRPSLRVRREESGDTHALVFRLEGKVTGTPECYEFLEEVRDAVRAGCRTVILDLERVEKMSSPGIGILAACYTSATRAQGRLGLVAVPEPVAVMLRIVCLWDLLPRFASSREALAALTQAQLR